MSEAKTGDGESRARASGITVRNVPEGPAVTPREGSIDERVKRLERKATVIRSRLMQTVDVLDARRHQVAKLGRRAKSGTSMLTVAPFSSAVASRRGNRKLLHA